MLLPINNITRAEAALIMFRLFMLLHEVSPVAAHMMPLGLLDPVGDVMPVAFEEVTTAVPYERASPPFPLVTVLILGVLGSAAMGGSIYLRRRRYRHY